MVGLVWMCTGLLLGMSFTLSTKKATYKFLQESQAKENKVKKELHKLIGKAVIP